MLVWMSYRHLCSSWSSSSSGDLARAHLLVVPRSCLGASYGLLCLPVLILIEESHRKLYLLLPELKPRLVSVSEVAEVIPEDGILVEFGLLTTDLCVPAYVVCYASMRHHLCHSCTFTCMFMLCRARGRGLPRGRAGPTRRLRFGRALPLRPMLARLRP